MVGLRKKACMLPLPLSLRLAFGAMALVLASGGAGRLSAFDWPVRDRVLMSAFGESRKDHFHPGIELGGEQPVYPIAEGELVFYHEEGKGYSSLPRGIGNAVVLQHEGEIQSVYAHLRSGSMHIEEPLIGPGDEYSLPMAVSGDSGAAVGSQLLFMIIDVVENEFLNPVGYDKPLLYPPLGSEGDTSRPFIGRVYLKRGGQVRELQDGDTVGAGEAVLLAAVYEESAFLTFFRRMAPYRIHLAQSGLATAGVVFDSLREKGGQLVVGEGELTFPEVYEDDWLYRLGTLSLVEGKIQLQIKAESHLGTDAVSILDLTVVSE